MLRYPARLFSTLLHRRKQQILGPIAELLRLVTQLFQLKDLLCPPMCMQQRLSDVTVDFYVACQPMIPGTISGWECIVGVDRGFLFWFAVFFCCLLCCSMQATVICFVQNCDCCHEQLWDLSLC